MGENYVPWMRSILDRMRELYNKPNAQTIAEALPELGGGSGGSGTDNNAVHYAQDSGKTEAQKQQARDNIDAAARSDIPDVSELEPKKLTVVFTYSNGLWSSDKLISDISDAATAGKTIIGVYVDANNRKNEFYLWRKHSLYADFVSVGYDNTTGNLTVKLFEIDDGGAVSYYEESFQKNPSSVTDLSSTSITLAPAANTKYKYGELTALTISSIPAGEFSIKFTSGSTPTVLTIPTGMNMPDDFAVKANTRYEINCDEDGDALVAGLAVSA